MVSYYFRKISTTKKMNTTRKNRTDQRRQVWSSHLKSIFFFRWFDYIFRKNICYYGYLYINREYTHKFVPHNRTNIWNSTVLYYATLTHLYIVYKQRANVVFFAEVSIQLNEPLYTLLYSIELNWTVLIVICIASYIISLVVLFSRVIFFFGLFDWACMTSMRWKKTIFENSIARCRL